MKGRTIIAFAIVAAVLAAAGPVAAQSAGLGVVSQHTTESDFQSGSLTDVTVHGSGTGSFVAGTTTQSLGDSASNVGPTSSQSISVNGDFDPRGPSGSGDPELTVTARKFMTEWVADFSDDCSGGGGYCLQSDGDSDSMDLDHGQSQTLEQVRINAEIGAAASSTDVAVLLDGTQVGTISVDGVDPKWYSLSGLSHQTSGSTTNVTLQVTDYDGDVYVTGGGSDPGKIQLHSPTPQGLSVSTDDGASASFGDFSDEQSKTRTIDLSTSSSSLDWAADTAGGEIDWQLDGQEVHYDGEGSYTSTAHDGSEIEEGFTNLTLNNAEAVVTWEYYDGSAWETADSTTYTTTGNHTADLSASDSEQWRVDVNFNALGSDPTARLNDEGILFAPQAPNITSASPQPGAEANDSEITLSADVEDPDLGTAQGDSVTAEFYMDGEKVDEQTITSNQTVSTTVEPSLGGTHNWSVEVEDSYGQTDSIVQREFNVPAELQVFSETDPETLVDEDNLSLSMQFYPLGEGDIQSREVTDGTVDLTGLPVSERFVVTVKANESDKFVYRRIVLDSIYDSEKIFLLRENQTHSDVTFELQDPTGQFPPEETELVVEKPISINGSTDYYPIAGDTFGASGRFPAALENDERYRLRVVSNETERILGAFTASGDELVPLQIQRIEPSAAEANAGSVYGTLTENGSTESLAVRFRNGQPGTEVTYRVTDEDTGDVVVPETTTTGVSFAHVYEFDVNETDSYNVSYEVTYPDGETQTGYFIEGEIGGIADRFDIDPQVLSIMSWVAILSSAGLVVIVDRKLAPAVGTGVSSLLTIIGTVAIPMPVLGIAGAISVLTLFGGRQ